MAPGVDLGIDPLNVLTPVLRICPVVGESEKNSLESRDWAYGRIWSFSKAQVGGLIHIIMFNVMDIH